MKVKNYKMLKKYTCYTFMVTWSIYIYICVYIAYILHMSGWQISPFLHDGVIPHDQSSNIEYTVSVTLYRTWSWIDSLVGKIYLFLIRVRRFVQQQPSLWTSRGRVVSDSESCICLYLKLVSTPFIGNMTVGHFILYILKMFPNNFWYFYDVLAMKCFHVSRHR